MRKSKKSQLLDIAQTLEENYYVLGVSGADAIVNIYDEIDAGYFDSQIQEWEITKHELYECVALLRASLTKRGLIKVAAYLP